MLPKPQPSRENQRSGSIHDEQPHIMVMEKRKGEVSYLLFFRPVVYRQTTLHSSHVLDIAPVVVCGGGGVDDE